MALSMLRTGLAGILCLAVIAALAGCSQQEQRKEEPLNVTLMREVSTEATTVNVTLRVGQIDMPEIVGSGWTNFVIRNADSVAHTFAIQGEGVDRLLPDRIEPGGMATLRIELKPGEYRVFSPDLASDTGPVSRQLVVVRW